MPKVRTADGGGETRGRQRPPRLEHHLFRRDWVRSGVRSRVGGCGRFEHPDGRGVMVFAFGGAIFALVGAVIGSNVSAKGKR
jgi:hypothetical protein